MNFKKYKALNKKSLELLQKKNSCENLQQKQEINHKLSNNAVELQLYSKLFDISVENFMEYFNLIAEKGSDIDVSKDCCLDVENNSKKSPRFILKVENVKNNVKDFHSQFESKDSKLISQEILFDFTVYDTKTKKSVGKLANGNISVLTNSENHLLKDEQIEQECLKPNVLKNTKFNLLTNDGKFVIDTIFNHNEKINNKFDNTMWKVAELEINRKCSLKLQKADAEIAQKKSELKQLQAGALEAIK